MEEEEEDKKKKQRVCKNKVVERKAFIRRYQRNGCMDLSELQAIYDSEGTNTLVMDSLG